MLVKPGSHAPRASSLWPRRALASLALVFATLGAPSPARTAEPRDPVAAQAAYEAGIKLMGAGDFSSACPKLEESDRLDPAMGTKFFLATCYEQAGRLASAWSLFLTVADQARLAGNQKREDTARERAAALVQRLPKLTIVVPEAVASYPDLTVERDGTAVGKALFGTEIPIDIGEHAVRAVASGKRAWQSTVRVDSPGQKVAVTIPTLEDAPKEPKEPQRAPKSPDTTPLSLAAKQRRTAALAVGGVGLAGIAVGSVFGAMASSAWSDAEAKCKSGFDSCAPGAKDAQERASSFATASTLGFIAGGALIAGAAIVWLSSPPRTTDKKKAARVHITPILGQRAMGGIIEGVF